MRLFSLMNASAIDDPEFGHFEPDPDHGGFDLPDELADRLHPFHFRKRRAWETDIERDERKHGEERDRRRDPETLYNAVADIANLTKQLAGAQAPAAGPDLAAELAELRRELAELRAAATPQPVADTSAESGSEDGVPAPAKPARARGKGAAAEA